MKNGSPETARELGNVTMDSLLLLGTTWDQPQKGIASHIDFVKLITWVTGVIIPWGGIAALLCR